MFKLKEAGQLLRATQLALADPSLCLRIIQKASFFKNMSYFKYFFCFVLENGPTLFGCIYCRN